MTYQHKTEFDQWPSLTVATVDTETGKTSRVSRPYADYYHATQEEKDEIVQRLQDSGKAILEVEKAFGLSPQGWLELSSDEKQRLLDDYEKRERLG